MVSYGIVRLGIFVTLALFALIVLGIGGHLIYGLAIATAVLTLIAIIPILVIDHFRRGTFAVWTAFELAWLFVLWVLWLATGANSATWSSWCGGTYYDYFGDYYYNYEGYCHELQALTAFAFINWILMFGLWIYILVMAIRAHQAGHTNIWQNSLMEYNQGGSNVAYGAPGSHNPMTNVSNEPKFATAPPGQGAVMV